MQLRISREKLLKPLSQVVGVVERRQTLPVLSNVLIKLDASQLILTGTDLEIEVVAAVDVEIREPGEVTVPARKFLDICRALPADATVDLAVKGEKATVKSGRSRFALATLPAADFPNLEVSQWDNTVRLGQGILKHLIERTEFSMAQQDVRYYLNGLLLEFGGNELRAVATDGHRMAVSTVSLDLPQSEVRQVIVPKKGVHELGRFLADSEETVELQISSNHIRANLPGLIFTSKLIDGRFPDYTKVIPDTQSKKIVLDREVFRDALARASILSNEKYRGVRLTIAPGLLSITAHNPEQEEAEEELEIDYRGEEMEIGFNANYITDAINALPSEQVELGLHDANSSGMLTAPGDGTTQYVVMPMRL